jgi:hypothetical protein
MSVTLIMGMYRARTTATLFTRGPETRTSGDDLKITVFGSRWLASEHECLSDWAPRLQPEAAMTLRHPCRRARPGQRPNNVTT